MGNNANWSDPTAWSTGAPPVSTDNVFVLPTNAAGTNTLTLTSNVSVNNLLLGDNSGGSAVLNLNAHSLYGTVNVLPSGEIVGQGSVTNYVYNAGTISLNAGVSAIALENNSGSISVSNGGDLQISGNPSNVGGTISATGNGTSNIANTYLDFQSVTLAGGNITATNSSALIRISNGNFSNVAFFGNVQLGGNLQDVTLNGGNISQTGTVFLAGTITNNDFWSGSFDLYNATTLNGNGTIVLGYIDQFGGPLTIGANQTILGNNTSIYTPIYNSGTIVCPGTAGAYSTFKLYLQSGISTNNGTISAVGGGQMTLQGNGGSFLNYNGTLSATGSGSPHNPASEFIILAGNIFGGQINTDSVGAISIQTGYGNNSLTDVQVNGNLFISGGTTLSAVTFNGTVVQSASVTFSGPVTNNANWSANGTIILSSSATLNGNGTLALIAGNLTATSNTTVLSIGPGQTIKGYGLIGTANLPLYFSNAGTISAAPISTANVTTVSALTLNLGKSYTGATSPHCANTGTLSAVGGATLSLVGQGDTLDNDLGVISATGGASNGSSGSLILLNNMYIIGGALSTDAVGTIRTIGDSGFSNLSINGNLNAHNGTLSLTDIVLNGNLMQDSSCNITLSGTITNNATWTQSGSASISADTFGGTGSITLNGGLITGITQYQSVFVESGQTIQGAGSIGSIINYGTTPGGTLYNLGKIAATLPTPSGIIINASVTNFGTLTTAPLCTMTLAAPLTSTAGIIHDDGTIQLNALSTTGPISGQGNLSVNAGTSAFPGLISDGIQLNALALNGSAQIRRNGTATGTTELQQLIFSTPSASLDLTNNALIVEITSPSTLSTLQSEIALGQSHTAGLFTSLPNMGLALIDNSALAIPYTTFGGLPVDSTSILILPALLGDANLDGKVDLNDLNAVLDNFGTPNANWIAGNFDGGSVIDLNDLDDVLNNLGLNLPNAGAADAASVGALLAASQPVPEPASLGVLGVAALFRLRRKHMALG